MIPVHEQERIRTETAEISEKEGEVPLNIGLFGRRRKGKKFQPLNFLVFLNFLNSLNKDDL